jgi:hypothetical protein
MKSGKPEIFAKFRLSIDNGFRDEYSYVDYRRWGVVELWSGCRVRGEPTTRRLRSEDRIEVWYNWALIGTHKSYADAGRQLREYLALAPVPLGELLDYLELR